MSQQEWPELAAEARALWEQNAGFWDDYMGAESNDFHNLLVRPATEKLLDIQSGAVVLDIGCGNGNFSRRLAESGVYVTAIDASETMIARAQARTTDQARYVTYQVVDATSKAQLLALGQARFDAAVSNMVLMDIPTLEPLLEALSQLLKPGGVFVFSVIHPCFQPPGVTRVVEEVDCEGELTTKYALTISNYITPAKSKGLAIIGQPAPQYYFHRPLHLLFKQCFQAGFVLTGLEEPVFDTAAEGDRPFSWANYKEIPPALVTRWQGNTNRPSLE